MECLLNTSAVNEFELLLLPGFIGVKTMEKKTAFSWARPSTQKLIAVASRWAQLTLWLQLPRFAETTTVNVPVVTTETTATAGHFLQHLRTSAHHLAAPTTTPTTDQDTCCSNRDNANPQSSGWRQEKRVNSAITKKTNTLHEP